MWWFLLVADLYFLSVGIRSMLEYGADQYNVVMVFCFLFSASLQAYGERYKLILWHGIWGV